MCVCLCVCLFVWMNGWIRVACGRGGDSRRALPVDLLQHVRQIDAKPLVPQCKHLPMCGSQLVHPRTPRSSAQQELLHPWLVQPRHVLGLQPQAEPLRQRPLQLGEVPIRVQQDEVRAALQGSGGVPAVDAFAEPVSKKGRLRYLLLTVIVYFYGAHRSSILVARELCRNMCPVTRPLCA